MSTMENLFRTLILKLEMMFKEADSNEDRRAETANQTQTTGLNAVRREVIEGVEILNGTLVEGLSTVNNTLIQGFNLVNECQTDNASVVVKGLAAIAIRVDNLEQQLALLLHATNPKLLDNYVEYKEKEIRDAQVQQEFRNIAERFKAGETIFEADVTRNRNAADAEGQDEKES